MRGYPLDLRQVSYSYLERPNRALLRLADRHLLARGGARTILDVGCGTGVNAANIREKHRDVRIIGIETHPAAAAEAAASCTSVFNGTVEQWLTSGEAEPVGGVILSDVLEHIADPVSFLQTLVADPRVRSARWVVSVPNYAVWYNRLRTLAGRFEYTWSGLYDRTHLRFYTRRSLRNLLGHCGLRVVESRCTPSLVQSFAPILRRRFDAAVERGEHQALAGSSAFRAYQRFVEPAEEAVCNLWPGLLGFQIVVAAEPA